MPSKLPTEMMKPVEEEVAPDKVEKKPEAQVFSIAEAVEKEQKEVKKKKPRGINAKSPEERKAHMEKMRLASLEKRRAKAVQKKLDKEKINTIQVEHKEPIEIEPEIEDEPIEDEPILIQHNNTNWQQKYEKTERELFEMKIRQDERNKLKEKTDIEKKERQGLAKNIAQVHTRPNNRLSALSKWASMGNGYVSNDPYDVYGAK